MATCIVVSELNFLIQDGVLTREFRWLADRVGHGKTTSEISVIFATQLGTDEFNMIQHVMTREGFLFVSGIMDLGFPISNINILPTYAVYIHLKTNYYNEVYFFGTVSLGFYSTIAKRQGHALRESLLIAVIANPTRFAMHVSSIWVNHPRILELDYMEEKTITYADDVWFMYDDSFQWISQRGWISKREQFNIQRIIDCPPLVTVCITHFNRSLLLQQSISSIMDQTYDKIEVIIVDDGSTDESVRDDLRRIESLNYRFPLKVIRRANGYLGAARNTGVEHASGKYIAFIDDDDVAKPNMIEILLKSAENMGSDIITSFMDKFEGDSFPDEGTHFLFRWVFLGGCVGTGLFYNSFGGANALIRLDTLKKLHGFTEDVGVGHEDWELYARATLQGHRVDVCPEATYWYRASQESMSGMTNMYKNYERSMRPYLASVPSDIQPLIELTFGIYWKSENLNHIINQLVGQLQEKNQLLGQFQEMGQRLAQQIGNMSSHIDHLKAERDQLIDQIKVLENR